jgi:hypothetical protein
VAALAQQHLARQTRRAQPRGTIASARSARGPSPLELAGHSGLFPAVGLRSSSKNCTVALRTVWYETVLL